MRPSQPGLDDDDYVSRANSQFWSVTSFIFSGKFVCRLIHYSIASALACENFISNVVSSLSLLSIYIYSACQRERASSNLTCVCACLVDSFCVYPIRHDVISRMNYNQNTCFASQLACILFERDAHKGNHRPAAPGIADTISPHFYCLCESTKLRLPLDHILCRFVCSLMRLDRICLVAL